MDRERDPQRRGERMASEPGAEFFEAQRPRLWGLAYRLTGSAADADDCVQEGFARWLERRGETTAPAGPWLVRVVTRLALDALRRRRRRAYHGPWLPVPVDAPERVAAL